MEGVTAQMGKTKEDFANLPYAQLEEILQRGITGAPNQYVTKDVNQLRTDQDVTV